MFLLGGSNDFPTTRAQFVDALNDGLAIFNLPKGVTKIDGDYPYLNDLQLDLTRAQISPDARPSLGTGQSENTVYIYSLEVMAMPLRVMKSSANFRLRAKEVQLRLDRDEQSRPVLAFYRATEGDLSFEITRAELESLITTLAKDAAAKQGVTVQSTRLTMKNDGPRAMTFEAKITAQKMFMATVVSITGRLDLDEQLNAKFSNLTCHGSGMIGSVAAGFIQPQLDKFARNSIPLTMFPLGETKLKTISIEAGDSLRVHAEFGG